jgi:hypothetical protein
MWKAAKSAAEYLFIGHNSGILTGLQSIFTLCAKQSGVRSHKANGVLFATFVVCVRSVISIF